ncbi:60S acidic ribosomal protein P2 [Aphelenchoides avenae]|nr:60S acidic ribosomal protein P2 [Aphelenchus avenae]
MKYVAAYLLATLGGKDAPTAKDIENILGSVGLDVDMENANAVVNGLKGKKVEEVIAAGSKKLASVPSGGAAPAAAAPAAGGSAPAAAAPAAKKEEKKEESEDEDMGFGLFD